MLAKAKASIVEHGPGVSLATLSRAIGLSPPALIKRFGSKERLLFRALLPAGRPRWADTLTEAPGDDPEAQLTDVLVELCEDFESVGPALAALRMSSLGTASIFPPNDPGPAVAVRRALASWLGRAGHPHPTAALADALVGAAEARGFLRWVGPQMIEPSDTRAWAERLAREAWGQHPRPA